MALLPSSWGIRLDSRYPKRMGKEKGGCFGGERRSLMIVSWDEIWCVMWVVEGGSVWIAIVKWKVRCMGTRSGN